VPCQIAGNPHGLVVSACPTATNKPSISDLEGLARFFGVPIAVFFPVDTQDQEQAP
jgi:hypothetical protein